MIIYLIIILLHILYIDCVSPKGPYLAGITLQLAVHICVLVNRYLLQNFMGKGCRTLRDIGSSKHLHIISLY